MDITIRDVGDVTVLSLAGDFWGRSGERDLFKSTIDKLLREGKHRIVLNFSRVKLVSSTGIGLIIAAHKRLAEAGGGMAVAEPSASVRPILILLNWPLGVFETEAEAIDSIG